MTVTDTRLARVEELLALYGGSEACLAELLCIRHPAEQVAFTVVDAEPRTTPLTYGALRPASERFAAALTSLGVGPGDRIATLMGKGIDQVVAVIGTWRAGAVHVPLFTAFATAAVTTRLVGRGAKVVVCDPSQRSKVDHGTVVVTGPGAPGDLSFAALLADHEPGLAAVVVDGDGDLIQLYTSGTTGAPKPVVMPVHGLASIHICVDVGLDVRPDDTYWNAADPGWACGPHYGLTGPLCLGITNTWLAGGFDAALPWRVLAELGIPNLAAGPTVYRASGRRHRPAGPRRTRTGRSASCPGTTT